MKKIITTTFIFLLSFMLFSCELNKDSNHSQSNNNGLSMGGDGNSSFEESKHTLVVNINYGKTIKNYNKAKDLRILETLNVVKKNSDYSTYKRELAYTHSSKDHYEMFIKETSFGTGKQKKESEAYALMVNKTYTKYQERNVIGTNISLQEEIDLPIISRLQDFSTNEILINSNVYSRIINKINEITNISTIDLNVKTIITLDNDYISKIEVSFLPLIDSIETYSKILYVIDFSFISQNVIFPAYIIGDDYQIDIPIDDVKYARLDNDPNKVVVKNIDIGKYDQRGLTYNPNYYDEQDKGESHYIKIGDIDILVDAGQNNNNNATRKAVQEVLDEYCTDNVVDYVIITHADADHYGGAVAVLQKYSVGHFIESSGTKTNSSYQNYQSFRKSRVQNDGAKFSTFRDMLDGVNDYSKKTLQLAPNVKIDFLDTEQYSTAAESNASSIVFILSAFETRYLFSGDAEMNQEKIYLSYAGGTIDILKGGHHGTRNGTGYDLLNALKPDHIIFCNGNNLGNQYGHPTSETINRIYSNDNTINIYAITGGGFGDYITYKSGNVLASVDKSPENSFIATFDPNRFEDRNSTITTTITIAGYIMKNGEGNNLIEISQTRFWKQNIYATRSHV